MCEIQIINGLAGWKSHVKGLGHAKVMGDSQQCPTHWPDVDLTPFVFGKIGYSWIGLRMYFDELLSKIISPVVCLLQIAV